MIAADFFACSSYWSPVTVLTRKGSIVVNFDLDTYKQKLT